MPTYQYACTQCGHELEAVQSFSDDALTVCPDCGGPLRKLFGSVGVVFKGSGFYRNDSRSTSSSTGTDSSSTPATSTPATSTPSTPAGASSGGSTSTTPAATS